QGDKKAMSLHSVCKNTAGLTAYGTQNSQCLTAKICSLFRPLKRLSCLSFKFLVAAQDAGYKSS
ncbi:MAG: hypothetical protein AAGF66_16895, partial [Cyanobacteria bacterium P01_H01_bin.119]